MIPSNWLLNKIYRRITKSVLNDVMVYKDVILNHF
jgi:hypothetical protein